MRDRLEQFVEKNRNEFDCHIPPEHVWHRIAGEVARKQQKRSVRLYAAAATVLLMAGAFVWFVSRPDNRTVSLKRAEVPLSQEIKQAEVYYASIVDTRRAELSRYSSEYPDLFKDFNSEIDTLRVLYSQLEEEYKRSNGNSAVLQALIDNLQTQVQLLNKQVQIIQEIQKPGKSNAKLL